jgi:uncharacterized membrane protein
MTRTLLVVATSLLGLSAGLFATFSYVVMPGLRRTGDATFVQAMRAINVAILNPVFVVVFVGAGLAAGMALVAGWNSDARPWLVAGTILYLVGAYVVTGAVNVPLNDGLESGTDSVGSLRAAFEDRWIVFNHARSVLTTIAFVCFAIGSSRR